MASAGSPSDLVPSDEPGGRHLLILSAWISGAVGAIEFARPHLVLLVGQQLSLLLDCHALGPGSSGPMRVHLHAPTLAELCSVAAST